MNFFRLNRNLAGIAALIATTLFATYPLRAQDAETPKPDTELAQVQEQNDLWQAFILADQTGQPTWVNDLVTVGVPNPADELLGATLQPIGDTLRAQLDIPAGQGLLITDLRAEGASARAGLKQNDILLSLADKPLATVDDLTKQLRTAGESAVPLKILRAGKPMTIQVRPIYRVTLGPVTKQKAEYYIGISVNAPDDAVRAQLGLPEGQGVVVNDVVSGSPAEAAGIKKHDVVLELNGKPIDKPETLAHQVQAAKHRPITLKLLHAGKPLTVSVTAAVRMAEADPAIETAVRFLLATRQPAEDLLLTRAARYRAALSQPESHDLRQRLDQVEKELNAVRAALDKINETLKAHKGTKRD
jgi:serine protease Do